MKMPVRRVDGSLRTHAMNDDMPPLNFSAKVFRETRHKFFVFYSRPGDEGRSRYSLEDLKINFRELLQSTS